MCILISSLTHSPNLSCLVPRMTAAVSYAHQAAASISLGKGDRPCNGVTQACASYFSSRVERPRVGPKGLIQGSGYSRAEFC